MIQDSRGFLWFGTQYGLNRFDGYSFKSYLNNPKDSLSISDNFIFSLAEDSKGNLWIGTQNGLDRYDFRKNKFERYLQYPEERLSVLSVIVDTQGIVWVGTNSRGLYNLTFKGNEFSRVTITNYRSDINNKYSLSSNLARCVFEDSKERIWVGTDKGLNLLINKNKGIFKSVDSVYKKNRTIEPQIATIYETNAKRLIIGSSVGLFSVIEDVNNSFLLTDFFNQDKKLVIPNTVISVCQDNSENLWFGTYIGGLYLWDQKNFILSQIGDNLNKINMQDKTIYSVLVDRSNVLWVGTKGSLLKCSPTINLFDNYDNEDRADNNESLTRTFLEDNKGKIWIGTDMNLRLFNPVKEEFETIKLENYSGTLKHGYGVCSFYQDKAGTFWMGTMHRGLYEMIKENGGEINKTEMSLFQYPDVYDLRAFDISEDKWNYLWIGTKYGVKRFNKKEKKFYDLAFSSDSKITPPNDLVFDIYQSSGNPDIFWLGARHNGLYQVYLGKKENEIIGLRHFLQESNKVNSLSSSLILTLLEDKKGRLWVGTAGGGLNVLNPDSVTFTHYNTGNGLPSDVITGILEDDLGYLWVSTFSGLCRFDPERGEVLNFHSSDGLLNDEFNAGAYYKNKNGELFFGGTEGFDVVNPENVRENKFIPPVVITGAQLFSNSVMNRIRDYTTDENENVYNVKGVLDLNYNENVLSFEFSALDFTNPANNKYAYLMDGIDTGWNYVGSRRFANYSKIPPGEYIFRVKAANNNGVWNNIGSSIIIIIHPPFWQTWWFKTILIIALFVIILVFHKYRVKKLEERKQLLEEQVKERTEAAKKIQVALSEVEQLKNQLQEENIYLQDEIKLTHNFENIISTSESFKKILYKVEQVSSTSSTVLLLGESGTGKELLARAIHSLSDRKNKPLIKINCATLPANLIESELFGHEKGSFTGAFTRKIGRFEVADGGTIFLDEIGELPLELQTKLLRVLQENEFERLGGTQPIRVDVRVIAATNRDLESSLEQGLFREDLYYRLNVFPITVPPLRERKEDIPVLVNHFISKHSKKIGKKIEPGLTITALSITFSSSR